MPEPSAPVKTKIRPCSNGCMTESTPDNDVRTFRGILTCFADARNSGVRVPARPIFWMSGRGGLIGDRFGVAVAIEVVGQER